MNCFLKIDKINKSVFQRDIMPYKKLLLLPFLALNLQANEPSINELLNMSLEELLEVKVSGITRQETDGFKSTSAVFVITSDEIRRFGATSIPQLLQMVPGFNVGQLSGNMWAINARGSANRFSRQLLMMIDGRNVYSPTVNNIYWDHVDTILEDIERIEIIRGPGSSLWGSNAANGIINIVTKNSKETIGAMAYVQAATNHLDYDAAARYGFETDKLAGRIYAKKMKIANGKYPDIDEQSREDRVEAGDEAHDGKVLSLAGFRSDIDFNDKISLMINAELSEIDTQEVKVFNSPAEDILVEQKSAHLISLLGVKHSANSKSKLQAYIDYHKRDTGELLDKRTVYDLDFQNETNWDSLTALWGLGYRLTDHETFQSSNIFAQALFPEDEKLDYYSGFLQLEYEFLDEKVALILGSKYEHNIYTGSEYMPNARIGIYPNDNNTIWLSASKSVATPSRNFADGYLDLSGVNDCSAFAGFGAVDHPELGCTLGVESRDGLNSSEIYSYELGYRVKVNEQAIIDQTIYHNKFKNHNDETDNLEYMRGYEISVRYIPRSDLRIDSFYSYQKGKNLEEASNDVAKNVPKHTFGWRTAYDFNEKTEFDLFYRHVSHVKDISAINQLNLRFGYRPIESLEASLLFTNLIDKEHIESNTDGTRANSYIERAVLIKLTYTY